MKKIWFLKVVGIYVCICAGLFLFTVHSSAQFFYNPWYQQPYNSYGYGYQQPYNPYGYGYQQPYNPYGYQQPYNPYSYQQPYNPYGYGYQQPYYPNDNNFAFSPSPFGYGYQQPYNSYADPWIWEGEPPPGWQPPSPPSGYTPLYSPHDFSFEDLFQPYYGG